MSGQNDAPVVLDLSRDGAAVDVATAGASSVVRPSVLARVGLLSMLFALAAVAPASAPTRGGPVGGRRPRRHVEEPCEGPRVEHVEAKGPRKLTRRERKARR